METKAQAVAYLHKFKNLDNKVIVKCRAAGKIWKKAHSPAEGLWLAEIIEIREVVMFSTAIVGSLLLPVKPAIKEGAKTLIDNLLNAHAEWDSTVLLALEDPERSARAKLSAARRALEKFIHTLIEEAM